MTYKERAVKEVYEKAPKEDKKEFMIWVSENVDKEIQGFVRCIYLGKKYNVLKRGSGYLKLKDMGVEVDEYRGVFNE